MKVHAIRGRSRCVINIADDFDGFSAFVMNRHAIIGRVGQRQHAL